MSSHLRLVLDLPEWSGRLPDPMRPVLWCWRGEQWSIELVGCVLCIERDWPTTISTCDVEGRESFHCFVHGSLVAVPYLMIQEHTISIGDVARTGEERVTDSMLFPASMDAVEQTALIETILDEMEDEEGADA